jgi:putative FmdB family regulatory protein
MPLYEYHCASCDGVFEVLVRTAGRDDRPNCPDCGSAEVRKLLSLVAARGRSADQSLPATATARPSYGGGCGCGSCGCH